ncbi:hypothetical protein B7494_g8221 [Chlorociboria aeruginascens]|nr:hypothetical protein B7494_g8221 [Chlorociboria aeruginascens]
MLMSSEIRGDEKLLLVGDDDARDLYGNRPGGQVYCNGLSSTARHIHSRTTSTSRPWSNKDWISSDDRVRGGSSRSYLDCSSSLPVAWFRGNLDIKTLGGAGFASQRTAENDRTWDLAEYDGLIIDISRSDGKQYTLVVKDELLPKRLDGREQSTISWEYDFKCPDNGKLFIAWDELRATYRGREQEDAKPLDLKNIKRFSLMMRRQVTILFRVSWRIALILASFFGTQEGDFSLSITSISVVKKAEGSTPTPHQDGPDAKEQNA